MGEWTKERIEAAEKRCKKATAGPWLGDEDIAYDIVDSHGEAIADVWSGTDDTVFIAAARTDLPDALAEIKAAAVALDAEINRSDKAADRPYSLAERIEFVITGLHREAQRGDCAEDEVRRLTLRIQGLEQANREAHQAIAKSKAHIDAADRRGDHAAQDRDTYKRERDEAQTELARVLAHIATLPAWCAPIPPPGPRPAALGGECTRCLARPGYHEGSCVCRMARTDVTPSQSRVLKAAVESVALGLTWPTAAKIVATLAPQGDATEHTLTVLRIAGLSGRIEFLGTGAPFRWLTIIVRENGRSVTSIGRWSERADAEQYLDGASAQWSDAYLCRIVKGPLGASESDAIGLTKEVALALAERMCRGIYTRLALHSVPPPDWMQDMIATALIRASCGETSPTEEVTIRPLA